MTAIQLRHMKLWFAGKALNWELAAYELRQLDTGLMEAATLYPGIPVSDVTTMARPAKSIADAIEARDGRRFAKAVGELTDGCNACHQSVGRGFIVMRTPTEQPSVTKCFRPKPSNSGRGSLQPPHRPCDLSHAVRRHIWRAIIKSSFGGMTHAEVLLLGVEIRSARGSCGLV